MSQHDPTAIFVTAVLEFLAGFGRKGDRSNLCERGTTAFSPMIAGIAMEHAMASKSAVNKNERRKALVARYAPKFARLKAIAADRDRSEEERLMARLKMAELPRNANPTRVRNRCAITGRPRAFYRRFRLARVMLRDLALRGFIPGVRKSSW